MDRRLNLLNDEHAKADSLLAVNLTLTLTHPQ